MSVYMHFFPHVLIVSPLFVFLCLLFWRALRFPFQEMSLTRIISFLMISVTIIAVINFISVCFMDHPETDFFDWYRAGDLTFSFRLKNDFTSAAFALCFGLIFAVVGFFSKTYLHREHGFFEFFYIYLVFISFTFLTVFASNFDTLFVGWELVGICSVILIGFYRFRKEAILGSLFTLSSYRIGEFFLLIALTMTHLVHSDVIYSGLGRFSAEDQWIIVLLILATYVKSAQWPFCAWLPRAMEGPTPSSAIFYGGISTHFGPMILLKIAPHLDPYWWVRPFLLTGAGISLVFAAGAGRTRNNIKSQLSYATIAQIAVIYIEIAMGWYALATFHSVMHCFLRTFQYLKSPSAIHDYYALRIRRSSFYIEKLYPERIRTLLYYITHSEFFIDNLMDAFLINPFFALCRKIEQAESFLSGEKSESLKDITHIKSCDYKNTEKEEHYASGIR